MTRGSGPGLWLTSRFNFFLLLSLKVAETGFLRAKSSYQQLKALGGNQTEKDGFLCSCRVFEDSAGQSHPLHHRFSRFPMSS